MENKRPKRQLWYFVFFLFCFNYHSQAQITQTIRGQVRDAATQKPLADATITLDLAVQKTSTNTEGVFRLEKIAIGRHQIHVSYVGYETVKLSDLLLESGKELVLDIALQTISTEMAAFTAISPREVTPINGIRNEKLSRYPATFNDPARLITYLPGATTDNDGTNNISLRGTSPNMVQWYLEGAEIVNPNHLSNAGVPSDQATVNGGGVLIPAFNVMDATHLYKGAMAADMGGALTGVMDIHLRKGNNEHRETQVSLGLVGLEVGTEGYFSKKSKASYLVHYRYSTIGLLSKLGVPLGDEAVTFQDLTASIHLPTKSAGTFKLFGMTGVSENVFEHLEPRTDWKTDKDSQDIRFDNRMIAVGAKHEMALARGKWSTVLAYSTLQNEHEAIGYGANMVPLRIINRASQPSKLFLKSVYQTCLNAHNSLKISAVGRHDFIRNTNSFKVGTSPSNSGFELESLWLQPSVEWQGRFGAWQIGLGGRGSIFVNLGKYLKSGYDFEPTAELAYHLPKGKIMATYSHQSQAVSYQILYYIWLPLDIVPFEKSRNFNLSYQARLTNRLNLTIEGFYQFLNQTNPASINEYDFPTIRISSYGLTTGKTIGGELDIQQTVQKGFYWRANLTLFDSKFKFRSAWRNTRFDAAYISNLMAGKEWTLGRQKNKILGLNLRGILRGGFWTSPIDISQSITNGLTIFDFRNPYSEQLANYYRVDMNLYWKKSRPKFSSTIQLDIQNVTNRLNEGWHYFDQRQGRIITKYQLGLIPNLAYKIEF
jgi:hypothetical protein